MSVSVYGNKNKKKSLKDLSGIEKIGLFVVAVVVLTAMLLFETVPSVVQQPELTKEEFVFIPFATEGIITVKSNSDLLSLGLDASNLPDGLVFAGWEIDGHKYYAKSSGVTIKKDLKESATIKAFAVKKGRYNGLLHPIISQELVLATTKSNSVITAQLPINLEDYSLACDPSDEI